MKTEATNLHYSIYRHGKGHGRTVSTAWFWALSVSRQGKLFYKCLEHDVYGREKAAFAMAVAHRDVSLHLLPPHTQGQLSTRLNKNHRSGIASVIRAEGRHMQAFFAHRGGTPFQVKYCNDPPGRASRLKPPAALAPYLPIFEIRECQPEDVNATAY